MRLIARLLPTISAAVMSTTSNKRSLPTTMSAATTFIEKINTEYEQLHRSFEMQACRTRFLARRTHFLMQRGTSGSSCHLALATVWI